MKKIITGLLLLLSGSISFANINDVEIQQALHAIEAGNGDFSEDHVFTCSDRFIVRCDEDSNVIHLVQWVTNENQLDVDLSIFTHLESYRLHQEIPLEKFPKGLANLSNLGHVVINAGVNTVPDIDGTAFPVNLYSLSVLASNSPVKLVNWNGHGLNNLTLNGVEIDFNFIELPNLTNLNLRDTPLLKNEALATFINVKTFNWQYALDNNDDAYYTTRAKFPLLADKAVEINLNRQHNEPKLSEVPAFVLAIPNLTSLEITGHAITELPETLFSKSSLKKLDVSSNEISTLPSMPVGSNIEVLNLSSNKFNEVPTELLQLQQLQILDINNNTISALPNDLFELPNLKELYASSNAIVSVDVSTASTPLEKLHLERNKLSTIPAELLQLDGLITLNLSRNEITSLPDFTGVNATLKNLNLGYNQLSTLPVGLLNDLSLQELNVVGNRLSSLPQGFVNNSLEALDFSLNEFTQVPDQLPNFTELKKVVLKKNKIESFGEQWKQSTSLEELDLSNNVLAQLTAEMLENLPSSLKRLNLTENALEGKMPDFNAANPELAVLIAKNALWSTDTNVLRKYANNGGLEEQLLPVRGVRVVEKNVNGELISYIQWGFPLMQGVNGRTAGIHPSNFSIFKLPGERFSNLNPGPYISTGYKVVIEYTEGKKAGETVTETFSCAVFLWMHLCSFETYAASYGKDTYSSSVFSYGVKGSLAGANITVYSLSLALGLQSTPTYWGRVSEHEQFVDELNYDENSLELIKVEKGNSNNFLLLVLCVLSLIRVSKRMPFSGRRL